VISQHIDLEWDAGDMGCGELVLELKKFLRDLAPGQVLKLTARDPGAVEDMPAWCRLTGHTLLEASPPNYWIKKKDEGNNLCQTSSVSV
jgi:tRNA 2-thiouridine synthesizing protein A